MWKRKKQKKHNHSERIRRGAVLLEALLAVVILSAAVTAVIQSMMSSLRASVVAADYLQAASLLNRFMIEHIVTSPPQEEKPLPPSLDRYRLAKEVKEPDPELKKLKLRGLQVSLSWAVNRNQRELMAGTLVPDEARP